jgi:hypothetical protein
MAIKLHHCGGAAHVLPRRRKPGPRRKDGLKNKLAIGRASIEDVLIFR